MSSGRLYSFSPFLYYNAVFDGLRMPSLPLPVVPLPFLSPVSHVRKSLTYLFSAGDSRSSGSRGPVGSQTCFLRTACGRVRTRRQLLCLPAESVGSSRHSPSLTSAPYRRGGAAANAGAPNSSPSLAAGEWGKHKAQRRSLSLAQCLFSGTLVWQSMHLVRRNVQYISRPGLSALFCSLSLFPSLPREDMGKT